MGTSMLPFHGPRRRPATVVLAAGLGLLALGTCWAQEPLSPATPLAPATPATGGAVAGVLAEALRKNVQDLATYRWQCRVELRLDGAERGAQYFHVRSDLEGRRRNQWIGGEFASGEGGPASRVVGDAPEGAAREWAAPLKRLAERYATLDPQKLQTATEIAVDSVTAQSRLVLRDVLEPADTLTIEMVPGGGRPLRFDVATSWGGTPVEISIEFSALPDGLFYDARTSIRATVEGRAVQLLVESFDFDR